MAKRIAAITEQPTTVQTKPRRRKKTGWRYRWVYDPRDPEVRGDNEYLKLFLEFQKKGAEQMEADPSLSSLSAIGFSDLRDKLVHRFAWAIPNDEALKVIAKLGPIVEIGAGTGYWAYLLQQRGVDIRPYDSNPPPGKNDWHAGASPHTKVYRGEAKKAAKFKDRTLMLCWPPYKSIMAYVALAHYEGKNVVYIGEHSGGCVGDKDFHTLLDEEFDLVKTVNIPQWFGIRDHLFVWRRK